MLTYKTNVIIPPLVRFLKRTPSEIKRMSLDDIITTLDVIYCDIVNEQRVIDNARFSK